MKKRDREQLRASIARDLVQGQGERSPTRELLRQYAPLAGVVTTPNLPPQPGGRAQPVENSLAPRATVERWATVKGELRVPNTINFSIFSDAESLCQSGLLPALSSLARLPAGHVHHRSREACQVVAHVAQKGSGHSGLPGEARTHQAARSESRGAVEGEYLPGSSAGRWPGS